MLKTLSLAAALAAALLTPARAADARKATEPWPRVQIAILLDTSGSMSGLIEQAKKQLWGVVNEFVTASKDGRRPELQVALYQYGMSSGSAKTGYMRRVLPLTDDLDEVSEKLAALRTRGSAEYCGMVISKATRELAWSRKPGDLKAIYIAGNEPFTQGPVDYRTACRAAIARGITVNTIHCGGRAAGVSGKWQDGASLADGSFAVIDHNRTEVLVKAPQDEKIAELSRKLNTTYVAYGARGKASAERQKAQDANAAGLSTASAAERAVTKANLHYRNDSWDLVDAVAGKKVRLEDVKREDLPANMQKMTLKEQRAFVAANAARRRATQAEINSLNAARVKVIAAEMKKRDAAGKKSLGAEMQRSVRAQAARQGFKF